MAAIYYAGKFGGFKLDPFPDTLFKINSWTYVKDKDVVDISNTNALGTAQFIGNLHTGSIKASGYVTDELIDLFDNNDIEIGQEAVFSLYFDNANQIGFADIDTVIDDFTFEDNIDGVSTFRLTALISEPKP